MVEKTKDREEPGVAGSFRRRYFHGDLEILDSMDRRLSRRGGIWTPTGRVEKGRGDRGMD